MPQTFCDLHCHSTASDGSMPPAAVVRLAHGSGLSAIALTDHDTVAGAAEAEKTAREIGIDFMPGIEISAEYPSPGTLHILGYGVDPTNPTLAKLTQTLIAGRDNRNPQIIKKLNEMGIDISMQQWQDESHGGVLGRPQLAALLVRNGHASTIKQAFEKFIGQGAPAYFDKERLSPRIAMEMIRQAGGAPVLAHATQLRKENFAQVENEIQNLKSQGLAGVEVIHSDYDQKTVDFLTHLADRLQLLKTGGSDFHGATKPGIRMGLANHRKIPREYFDRLVDQVRTLRKTG